MLKQQTPSNASAGEPEQRENYRLKEQYDQQRDQLAREREDYEQQLQREKEENKQRHVQFMDLLKEQKEQMDQQKEHMDCRKSTWTAERAHGLQKEHMDRQIEELKREKDKLLDMFKQQISGTRTPQQ